MDVINALSQTVPFHIIVLAKVLRQVLTVVNCNASFHFFNCFQDTLFNVFRASMASGQCKLGLLISTIDLMLLNSQCELGKVLVVESLIPFRLKEFLADFIRILNESLEISVYLVRVCFMGLGKWSYQAKLT